MKKGDLVRYVKTCKSSWGYLEEESYEAAKERMAPHIGKLFIVATVSDTGNNSVSLVPLDPTYRDKIAWFGEEEVALVKTAEQLTNFGNEGNSDLIEAAQNILDYCGATIKHMFADDLVDDLYKAIEEAKK